MAEFLKFTWEMLLDWPIGTVIVVLMSSLILLLVGVIVIWIFRTIDCSLGTPESGTCTVVGKTFTDEYTRFLMVGKVMIPQHVDPSWEITLEKNGYQDTISVTQEYYRKMHQGKKVHADYVWGKITGGLYIQEVY